MEERLVRIGTRSWEPTVGRFNEPVDSAKSLDYPLLRTRSPTKSCGHSGRVWIYADWPLMTWIPAILVRTWHYCHWVVCGAIVVSPVHFSLSLSFHWLLNTSVPILEFCTSISLQMLWERVWLIWRSLLFKAVISVSPGLEDIAYFTTEVLLSGACVSDGPPFSTALPEGNRIV